MLIGVIFARIIAEFVLIMFRINEHLGAIRQRGQSDRERSTSTDLRRKPEMHDVAVGDHIILAFQPHLADVARAGFAAERHIVVVGDGLGADEAALEIGVDDAGRLRRLGAARDRPGAASFGPAVK